MHAVSCSAAAAAEENMVMVAPVPNPEAGTLEGLEYFGRLLDLSRSEGWGTLRQGLESRLVADLLEHHSPAKNGDRGQPHGFTSARKRSYKRAILRARQHGSTYYKGRAVDESDLLGFYTSNGQQTSQPTRQSRPSGSTTSRSESSLSMLSWNCGGLSSLQDELITLFTSYVCRKPGFVVTWILAQGAGSALIVVLANRHSVRMLE